MGLRASGLSKNDVMQTPPPSVPVSGGTVTVVNNGIMGLTVINPAGALAALTVSLPVDANSMVGQIERIAFLKAITTLTVNVSGGGTVSGAPSTAQANDNIGFQKVAANLWARLT